MSLFQPLQPSTPDGQNLNQINQMIAQVNQEQTVKTFKQANGNAIVQGKLPYDGGYGSLYYGSDGTPRIVIGILPDGTVGLAVSKEGFSVLDELA